MTRPPTPPPAVRTQRLSTDDVGRIKSRGVPIVMVTAYDFNTASVADAAGVDIVLVGDSAAMTMLGYDSTRSVSLDEMLMLTRAVRRGLTRPLLVGDLPFGSYERSDAQALDTAARFVEAGCDAVKLEGGGVERIARVRALISSGIPVMGHVGLTPQSTGEGEGFRVAGRRAADALEIFEAARALEGAGCFAIVFEAIPAAVAELLVPRIGVPVIGIGAGAGTDGQVLVFDDLVGLYDGRSPRFVKRYGEARAQMVSAVEQYAAEVRARSFPDAEHGYSVDAAALEELRVLLTKTA
jgi:3-methyl-2-oxobutanoate hydroxymethyltransferase